MNNDGMDPKTPETRRFGNRDDDLYRSIRDIMEKCGVPEDVSEFSKQMIKKVQDDTPKVTRMPIPLRLEAGQIWTTSAVVRDHRGIDVTRTPIAGPVMIVSAGTGRKTFQNIIRVMPLSHDTDHQWEPETLLLSDTSPLGYPVLMEIFNECPMLAGNLQEYRGSVTPEDFKRIQETRNRFLDGFLTDDDTDEPGSAYLKWKTARLRHAEYLRCPVNECVWEEEPAVLIEPVRRAAGPREAVPVRPIPHVLYQSPEFTAVIVQLNDRVVLRCGFENCADAQVRINGKPAEFRPAGENLYETDLGFADTLASSVSIEIQAGNQAYEFHKQFQRSE